MENLSIIDYLEKGYRYWPVLFIWVLIWVIRNPDKVQIWISFVERIISYISSKYERKTIADEIEGRLNDFSKKINHELGDNDIMPYGIKIDWVEEMEEPIDRISFISNNQVIVKMKYHKNRDRNVTIATLNYVSKNLVPKARIFINKNILKSIDFKMVQKTLNNYKLYSAIEVFSEEILSPIVQEIPEVGSYLEKMDNLDDKGFFNQVLLFELMLLGRKIYQVTESVRKRAIAETKKFILFLDDIASRPRGVEVELIFIKKEIRVGIVLVAKEWKEELYGSEPYIRRIGMNIRMGCERVYVFARQRNINFAKKIIREVEDLGQLNKIIEKHLKVVDRYGNFTKGYYAIFQVKTDTD